MAILLKRVFVLCFCLSFWNLRLEFYFLIHCCFFFHKLHLKIVMCSAKDICESFITHWELQNCYSFPFDISIFKYSNISASKQELLFMFTYLGKNLVNSIKLRGRRPAVDETLTNFGPDVTAIVRQKSCKSFETTWHRISRKVFRYSESKSLLHLWAKMCFCSDDFTTWLEL